MFSHGKSGPSDPARMMPVMKMIPIRYVFMPTPLNRPVFIAGVISRKSHSPNGKSLKKVDVFGFTICLNLVIKFVPTAVGVLGKG